MFIKSTLLQFKILYLLNQNGINKHLTIDASFIIKCEHILLLQVCKKGGMFRQGKDIYMSIQYYIELTHQLSGLCNKSHLH